MFSIGMSDANQGSKDFCFYYDLITQNREISQEHEDCWVIVATQLTQCYDSDYHALTSIKLRQVTQQAVRKCSGG
jgi:hypothetical protein